MAWMARDIATFRRIHKRQWRDRWHADYDAAIHATGREAPKVSQATILVPQKVGMRDFHCLSNPETWASLLALYHPAVWEIHEQRILYPTPRPHYLDSHPRGAGRLWHPFAGVLDVADRLGMLRFIRCIRIPRDDSAELFSVPVLWVGDLLLYLEDAEGPYLINWSVKDKVAAFGIPGPRRDGKMPRERECERAKGRHQIEVVYYADAGTRTQEVAGEQIDFDLRCNLRDLFLDHATRIEVGAEECARAVELFGGAVGSGEPANQIIRAVAGCLHMTSEEARTLLRQAVWHRHVRIDLFRPFHMDKPLYPEREDPLHRYAAWFSR